MQSRNEVRDEPERRRANSLVLIVFQNGKQSKAVQIKKKDKFQNMLDKVRGGVVYFFLLLFLMESVRRTLPEIASKFFFSQVRVANFLIKPPL